MAAAHLSAATGMSAVGLTGRCVQGPSRPRGYRPAQMRREEIIAILARVLCAGLAPTPMIADTLACLLLVLGVAFGLSRPLLDRFRLEPAEDLVAGAALSLVAAWGIAWAVFASGCPLWGYWLLPAPPPGPGRRLRALAAAARPVPAGAGRGPRGGRRALACRGVGDRLGRVRERLPPLGVLAPAGAGRSQ